MPIWLARLLLYEAWLIVDIKRFSFFYNLPFVNHFSKSLYWLNIKLAKNDTFSYMKYRITMSSLRNKRVPPRNFWIAKKHTPNTPTQCSIINASWELTVRQNKSSRPTKVEAKRNLRNGRIWAGVPMSDFLASSSHDSPAGSRVSLPSQVYACM